VGPGGAVADQRTISATAPAVRIATPPVLPTPGGSIRLDWEGTDADGDALVYTIQYSADSESWETVAFEQPETSATISIAGRPRDPRVRVIATDGGRSTTTEVTLSRR
jgi:hypothetical protein